MRLKADPDHALYPEEPWLRSFVDWSERTPARDEDWQKHDYTGLGPDSCDFENFCDLGPLVEAEAAENDPEMVEPAEEILNLDEAERDWLEGLG